MLTSQNWYFSHNLISSKVDAADEIMSKVRQFWEVKMDFNIGNSLKKVTYLRVSVYTGP